MLNQYLKKLLKISSSGDATEESYYPAIASLFESFFESEKIKNGSITTLPKKMAGNKPDFVIRKGRELVGYIEAKDFSKIDNLEKIENDEQIERYKKYFDNFILTNFIDFWLWRKSEKNWVKKINIAKSRLITKIKTLPPLENEERCIGLLQEFINFSIPETKSAKQLAIELASRAKRMKEPLLEELKNNIETDVDKIYRAFKNYLMPDLTEENFVDIYAQVITYGLFIARLQFNGAGKDFNRTVARDLIPKNLKILRDTFSFVSRRDLTQNVDYIIDDIATVLAYCNIKRIKNDLHKEKGKDPIVHFYETFLIEYDPEKRKKMGEYYTPLPVVSYIIHSINLLLKEKFGKNLGFASQGVTLLDFASGTCTFPAQAIVHAEEETNASNNSGSWLSIIKNHILENFYAFEISMASWIIGHLKIALLLEDLGYKMTNGDRFKLYLTNTLDFTQIKGQDEIFISDLSEEGKKAGEVKRDKPILVIMGNPPYSGHSSNIGEWISKEIKAYYKVDNKPLDERNPKWLQDDYVKFIRFAQWKIDRMNEGIVGIITNHSYLDNPTFRGMRQSLMKSFDEIYILDLHGNSLKKEEAPSGIRDENVFDIRQGVAIAFFIKNSNSDKKHKIFHSEIWGSRQEKYNWLSGKNIASTRWNKIDPKSEFYLFIPRDENLSSKYQNFSKITDIFPVNSVGIATARDSLVVNSNKEDLKRNISKFIDINLPDNIIKETFKLKDKKNWIIKNVREKLKYESIDLGNYIMKITYRPFDDRYIFYHSNLIERLRKEIMHNMTKDNMGLITTRFVFRKNLGFRHAFVTKSFLDINQIHSPGTAQLFPLYLYNEKETKTILNGQRTLDLSGIRSKLDEQKGKTPNIKKEIFNLLKNNYKKKVSPEEIFYYIYAVLYSNKYRQKYNEFLKIDFPRIPFISNYSLFIKISKLGQELVDLHLLKSKNLEKLSAKFKGTGLNDVKKREYDQKEKRIYINDSQYFEGIDPGIWNYYIGGYQVLDKWMKDRIGRSLSREDVEHYLRIIESLRNTIDLQKEIDKFYPEIEKNLI